ncbi:hypothetical protein SAMD00023353_0801920 [Rosellinia necatrix]|uniref:Uncharacterized protein n=1 Tax=Rosellinia necatrix TaxID=77044 RepID=A0A1W2TB50_ROSNE|nr:hypothetical protein SAMD00023353_0801920 [Rosellinia necatrix]
MTDRSPPETGVVLTAKSNRRKINAQPFGNRHPSGKGLGGTESKENSITSDTNGPVRAIPRPTPPSIYGHRQTGSLVERRVTSSPSPSPSPSIRADRSTTSLGNHRHSLNTRIPRPAAAGPVHTSTPRRDISKHQNPLPAQNPDHSSPMRQPMTVSAAVKRAKEQAAAEEATDSDNTIDLQYAFNKADDEFNAVRGIDGSPSPAPRPFRREFKSAIPSRKGGSPNTSDLAKQLQRFDRNHQLAGGNGALNGLFAKNRPGPMVSEIGRILANDIVDSAPGDNAKQKLPDTQGPGVRKRDTTEGDAALGERVPATGAYSSGISADIPVPSIEYESASDDQLSPNFQPIGLSPEKNMNWHLDADFTAEDLQFSQSPRIATGRSRSNSGRQTDMPESHSINDRLSQIQEREAKAAGTSFPEDAPIVIQTNAKLQEIKAREIEASSKRAVASSRLDEIRIRNAEPHSKSPETGKNQYENGAVRLDTERQNAAKNNSNSEYRGEPIRDTPIVVFKNTSDRINGVGDRDRIQDNDGKSENLARSDSHDLLRRLARATSSSPGEDSKGTEQDKEAPATKADINQPSESWKPNRSLLRQEGGARSLEVKNLRDRPTVGFADLIRIPSSDSVGGKRTSVPASEVDPTDRIAAELNLFAPLDNYSEKGSIRAPSPVSSEPVDGQTPRPPKIDPLTQPTPRVTGAYVDTPATVRVKKEDGGMKSDLEEPVAPEGAQTTQDRNSSLSPTKRIKNPYTTDRARPTKRSGPRSSSAPTAARRSRSSSRRRRPLINTANPPTVREDIVSILRANNIDDSTLENLDSILADHDVDEELKQIVDNAVLHAENNPDVKVSEMSDHERELETYDRMRKSLQTGLLGIRSAKKGIERLEDKVTHHSDKNVKPRPGTASDAKPIPQPSLSPGETAPIFISVPRLYRRTPAFKLTKFGIITICGLLWYILECIFCSLYAGPDYICTPSVPCDWSPNEPYFPYTMPFMLDEWATGGKGRALAFRMGEELGDILAEISDWATNTDFTQLDELYMDVWQRKRHKRRLRKRRANQKWTEPLGYKAHFPEWQATGTVGELTEEFGLDGEYETMDADEILR